MARDHAGGGTHGGFAVTTVAENTERVRRIFVDPLAQRQQVVAGPGRPILRVGPAGTLASGAASALQRLLQSLWNPATPSPPAIL